MYSALSSPNKTVFCVDQCMHLIYREFLHPSLVELKKHSQFIQPKSKHILQYHFKTKALYKLDFFHRLFY